jgi:tight adherence protein B
MRERERIRGEIQTLTVQQRLTGLVIASLPVGLALLFFVINPDYMQVLFDEKIGQMMVAGAIVLEVIGAYVIKRIVNIEV